jgi:glutamine synthetase
MHCHQSIWKDGSPLFYDEVGYAGLSDTGRYYIGGLLKHAPSLLAFTNPTANSYHRLVPGAAYYLITAGGIVVSLGIIAATFPLLARITGPEFARNE